VVIEEKLNQLFSQVGSELPAKGAKEYAIKAAREAFLQVQDSDKIITSGQGINSVSRLIHSGYSRIRRLRMFTVNKWSVSGLVASVMVLIITLTEPFQPQSKFGILTHNVAGIVAYDVGGPYKDQFHFDFFSMLPEEAYMSAEKEFNKLNQNIDRSNNRVLQVAPPQQPESFGYDKFQSYDESRIKAVSKEPFSTFSIDVDTSAYSYVRRELNQDRIPNPDSVRIEEMINYFDYQYELPTHPGRPFKVSTVVTESPWKEGNKLLHIGLRGYDAVKDEVPDSNLVFLIDVSGSMTSKDRLPLLKKSLRILLKQLKPSDTVSIVTYAGGAQTILNPTQVVEKQKIIAALESLSPGGGTAGGDGIQLAYSLAEAGYQEGAVNRIILATDGDFNIGVRDTNQLRQLIEQKRKSGIYLSVLGVGEGNYNDSIMQSLAQNGNGVAAYIDTLSEANKVLGEQATSMLFTIAKDVKIQVEFNPTTVKEYRLLGYESRNLRREDFNNDHVDAGEIGAGHTVTAIYEITPAGAESGLLDDPHYAENKSPVPASKSLDEYGLIKIRYKLPGSDVSELMTESLSINPVVSDTLKREANFATAVAAFAQRLKGSQYIGDMEYAEIVTMALRNKGNDSYGYRAELGNLIRKSMLISGL
jgi:Ca-activated chloride channel homolog